MRRSPAREQGCRKLGVVAWRRWSYHRFMKRESPTAESPYHANPLLPEVVAAYFAAANARESDLAATFFGPDAIVHDEGGEHVGPAAIRDWVEETGRKYEPQTEVLRVEEAEGRTVVTCTVSGTFPGSPAEITFAFALRDDVIVDLSIQ